MARNGEAAISDADEGADDNKDFDAKADILPDSLFDKHIPKAGGAKTTRKPAADEDLDDDELVDDEDNLDDEDLDDDDLDDDEDDEDGEQDDDLGDDEDSGDEDDLDDEDDDEDEEKDEDDEDDEVLSGLSSAELKEIEKDPKLRKAHKLMQRHFTKRTTEVAAKEREVEQRSTRIDQFETAIQTPRGMATFLARNLEAHPDVIGAAFEAVATGEGAESFLVEVGLHNPDLFAKAFERVQELEEDEDAKKRHIQRRDNEAESSRINRDKLQLAAERFEKQSAPLVAFAERVATKAGVHPDDLVEVKKAVAAKLKEARKENGSVDLTKDDVKAVVKSVKKGLDAQYERVRTRLGREKAGKKQKQLKDKLGKRKPARSEDRKGEHGGATKRTADRKARKENPVNVGDSVFGFIDQRLGLNNRIARPKPGRSKRR